jgi:mRNA interferase HicA
MEDCWMKRRDLINLLERNGWRMKRDDGKHTVYEKGKNREAIPRHRELDEGLAREIIR